MINILILQLIIQLRTIIQIFNNLYLMNQNTNSYKTSLCRHYINKGHCSLYQNCHFAHGKNQLRQKIEPLPFNPPPQFTPISIYKTQLCKYFMKGYCRNDTQCPFAHGATDFHAMVVTSSVPIAPVPVPVAPVAAKPDFQQAGQFLLSILRNLQQVFPQQINKKVLIKKGIELVQSGQLPEANQIINQLVSSSTLSDKQKEQCQTIMTNAYTLHKINCMKF